MNKFVALAVAVVAVAIAGQDANAQSFSFNKGSFNTGYQFGAGVGAARGIHPRGFGLVNQGFGFGPFVGARSFGRPVRPPYFAEFPPVYYSGIVKRPYGVSPYAVPGGIEPVEMRYQKKAVEPVVINNPYFNRHNDQPVSAIEKKDDVKATKNKSTRVINRFYSTEPVSHGPIVNASFDSIESN